MRQPETVPLHEIGMESVAVFHRIMMRNHFKNRDNFVLSCHCVGDVGSLWLSFAMKSESAICFQAAA